MANKSKQGSLIAVIGDEDTTVGFLLGGIGDINSKREANYLVVTKDTTVTQVEDAFKHFVSRPDIAIILITQSVRLAVQNIAEDIRPLLDSHTAVTPAVLEIPSKDQPYDPAKDSILKRARGLFSAEDFK